MTGMISILALVLGVAIGMVLSCLVILVWTKRTKRHAYIQYRQLEEQLIKVRDANDGRESAKEDALLDQMDDVWWSLSEDDRRRLQAEPPKSIIRKDYVS